MILTEIYKRRLIELAGLQQEKTDLTKLSYRVRYPKKNEIIFVSPTKLLDRLEKDAPAFNVRNKNNQIGDRVERAKDFILNYADDQRWINPNNGERLDYNKAVFGPSLVEINNGKISFGDGRHRVLAAEELGIDRVAIEVPREQVDLFKDML